MDEFQEFHRKSFKVSAVQITEENMISVAATCGGEYRERIDIKGWVRKTDPRHIYLKKGSGTGGHSHTMAFVGDWILTTNFVSFRIYSDKAFKGIFESKWNKMHREHLENADVHARNETIVQLIMKAMRAQDAATYHGDSNGDMDLMAKQTADEIVKLFV